MSGVDLDRNREALSKAQAQVADIINKTNWALCGYEGKTNVIKLVETGDGGLDELVDELSSGKIQYAFCQITDPNTGLPKNVFINWQGEGVPELRKGSCANHVMDVSKFFRSAHMTINARNEDDLDEDLIKERLARASGSNYSVHKEQRQAKFDAPITPVGSVYKKTRADAEIAKSSRGQFWENVQEEQKKDKQVEVRQRRDSQSRLDSERKEREALEAGERDRREGDRVRKIREQKAYEKRAEAHDKTAEKEKWEKQQREAMRDVDERAQRSERMRKERAAEARALVSQRSTEKTPFDQRPPSQFDEPSSPPARGAPPTRQLKHAFLQDQDAPQPTTRKQPIQLPTGDGEPVSPTSPTTRAPAPAPTPAYTAPAPSKPPRHTEPEVSRPPPRREPSPEPVRASQPPPTSPPAVPTSPAPTSPQGKSLLSQHLPPRQDSDDEEQDDQDWEGEENTSKPKAVIAQPIAEPDELYDDVKADTGPELYDDVRAETGPAPGGPPVQQEPLQDSNKGMCARALFDYQEAEENEITFDPDDIITNIEQIDEGWWLGVGPDGRRGMFPANYVELL